MNDLKLYVWKGVFFESPKGMACALAPDIESAIASVMKMVRDTLGEIQTKGWEDELRRKEPIITDKAQGFYH